MCTFHPSSCESRAAPVFRQLGHRRFSTQWSRTIIPQISAMAGRIQANILRCGHLNVEAGIWVKPMLPSTVI